eukprot:2584713-Alexandrium_andersonii.AAC.1
MVLQLMRWLWRRGLRLLRRIAGRPLPAQASQAAAALPEDPAAGERLRAPARVVPAKAANPSLPVPPPPPGQPPPGPWVRPPPPPPPLPAGRPTWWPAASLFWTEASKVPPPPPPPVPAGGFAQPPVPTGPHPPHGLRPKGPPALLLQAGWQPPPVAKGPAVV